MPRWSTSILPSCPLRRRWGSGRRNNLSPLCVTTPDAPAYNNSLRQLLHVGFKVAAKMGTRYLDLLSVMETTIARNVTENLFDRHIKPVFMGC